jgi:hypothetical protein
LSWRCCELGETGDVVGRGAGQAGRILELAGPSDAAAARKTRHSCT